MKQKRLGEILKQKRLEKKLRFEDVEKVTKIRAKFLQALEEGNYTTVSQSYSRGFLKNYADFLGLDASLMLALFRRETEKQSHVVLPKHLSGNSLFRLTPTRGFIIGVCIVLSLIAFFIYQQYKGYLGVPNVTIESPKENATVSQDVTIVGQTDSDATLFVNTDTVALDQDGKFSKKLKLFRGEATITITAKNRRGKETTVVRHIVVQ
jgi:cytoskeletal protein RodZ